VLKAPVRLDFQYENPRQFPAWNMDWEDQQKPPYDYVHGPAKIQIIESGPVRSTIEVTRQTNGSKFVQDISLTAGGEKVEVVNKIDWQTKETALKASIPLASGNSKATYDIALGAIERANNDPKKYEVPQHQWFNVDSPDKSYGVGILNDSKYGYDALGNTLRITLLRSPTWPDAEADQGHQHFTYALYPHTGTWKQAETVRRGYELNTPLIATQVMPHTGSLPPTHSFASVENKNVTLTAMKKAEDSDALVFRMYEWAGTASQVKLHVPTGAQYAVESNLMEKVEGPHLPLSADTVTVPIKPYEILTVQVVYPHSEASAK